MSASSRSETVRKTFAANGDVLTLPLNGLPAVGLTITGTWTGTLQVEETFDGDIWGNAKVLTELDATVSLPLTANQIGLIKGHGRAAVRVRASAAMTGSAVVVLNATEGLVTAGTGGGPVTVADGADSALGTTTDAGITTDVSGTVIGFLRGGIKQWAAFLARFPAALGGTTAANSLPVTLSTDGPFVSQTGSITETAPATDTASSGLNGRAQRIAQRLTSLIALLPASIGSKTAAASLGVALATDEPLIGALTEAAPATDIASSGLNGRLQRIAQRLTTLIGTNLLTQGDVAHGASDSGNPNKLGYVAIAHGANPSAVTAAQRTNAYANRAGVPFVIGGHPNIQTIGFNFTGAQTDTAIVTVASGLKIVVTGFLITCSNANTVNVSARLGFGTVNTPAYGAAGLIGTHPNVAPGSGFGRGGGSGIVGVGTDDQDLRLTCGVPTGGSLDCMVSYYTIES